MKKYILIILVLLLSLIVFPIKISFYYTQDASNVYITGDFTNFSPVPLNKTQTGLWKTTFNLSEGIYKYLYIIDGKETLDYKNINTKYFNGKIYSLLIIKREGEKIVAVGDGIINLAKHELKRKYINPVKKGEIYLAVEVKKNDVEDVIFVGNGEILNKEIIDFSDTLLYRFHIKTPSDILKYHFLIKDGKTTIQIPENNFFFDFENPAIKYFDVPEWAKGRIFYQIFPERFRNGNKDNDPIYTNNWNGPYTQESLGSHSFYGGDLQGVIDSIDYLTELGIEGIYFNPIFESVSSHKYDTKDYLKIDPHFGDDNLFAKLVNKLHEKDIKIILDGVFNHSGDEFFAMEDIFKKQDNSKYLNWYYIKKFPVIKSPESYECWWGYPDLPKLNIDNPEVKAYFSRIIGKWMEFDIDGWRLDAVEQIKDSFWEDFFRPLVKGINDNALISGEYWKDSTHYFEKPAFDTVMNYLFRDAAILYAKGGSASYFIKNTNDYLKKYPPQVWHILWNLLDSHDTPRILHELNGDVQRFKIAVALQMTFIGAPLIYYGDEIGLDGGGDPWCRKPFPWDKSKWNKDILNYYKSLIKLRKENPALRYGDYIILKKKLGTLIYKRVYNNNEVIVITNSRKTPAKINLELNNEYIDYFTKEKITKINKVNGLEIKILIRQ